MHIVVTGSTGLIGSALARSLRADGHQVVALVRDRVAGSPWWDPMAGQVAPGALDGADAVVHLARAGVGDKRWSTAYKREIRDSRVLGTQAIARATAAAGIPVLVSASATGFYGDTGDRVIDETAPAGNDFLAGVCAGWEAAADPARAAGVRVVHPRTGLVVAAKGGAFGRLLPLFRLGLGGRLGSGDQYWPFISLADHIAALRFAIDNPRLSGPVNFTAPEPLTNRDITRAAGRALHRPTIAAVPSFALRAALGEFATGITGSCRAIPAALRNAGFAFRHATIDAALEAVIAA